MEKIKSAAVIIQNFIQYESFKPAIDVMLKRGIKVDVFVPTVDLSEHIWDKMYDIAANQLSSFGLNVVREVNDTNYDLLFTTHLIEQFRNIKRKYTIKYRYGFTSKPWYALNLEKNYFWDVILTYGPNDSETFLPYGKVFEIGNIKYAYFKNKNRQNSAKLNVLYLPTYGEGSSYYDLVPELIKVKDEFNIMIKLHHGTNYLEDETEKKIKKLVDENFDKIYTSEQSLLEILEDIDVVISDNSGAVGDAIAARIPLIVYGQDQRKYGNFVPAQQILAMQNNIIALNSPQEIGDVLKFQLKKYTAEMLDNSFDFLYGCKNEETINRFNEFLDAIENGFISDDYHFIIENEIVDFENKLSLLNKYEIDNEVLKERLDNSYKIIERLEKKIEEITNKKASEHKEGLFAKFKREKGDKK